MRLTKKVIIPNDEIGMITVTPDGIKIMIENDNLGTLTIEAESLSSLSYDLGILGRSIDRDLEECIKEQKGETYEETYRRIVNE